jgi:hypothetical protein
MESFKVIVELSSDSRVSSDKDNKEHANNNPSSNHVYQAILLLILSILHSSQDSVSKIPRSSSDTSTTVKTSIVEYFGKTLADPDRPRVWYQNGDFVAEIDEFFLAEENADHEVG